MRDEWDDKTCDSRTRPSLMLRTGSRTRPAVLRQIEGPGFGRTFLLGGQTVLIGREEGADVQVESPQVSRRHARIELSRAGHRIEDLRSRNGTFLNGVRIHAAVLSPGDRIGVGEAVFEFEEGR